MNVLIAGMGKGSWEIRGMQLGAALGARIVSTPTAADWSWATVAVLVKRAGFRLAPAAHAAGVPIVWDALDFWSQPRENALTERAARQLLADAIVDIRPALTVGATRAMADACHGDCLPHHSWANLQPQPARAHVSVVAYEGNPAYLGRWAEIIRKACAARGWQFVVNPPDLREVDLFVAFRDGIWDGYMCRQWKSGVKVVNAMAAGRPIIGQASAALDDLHPAATIVEDPQELDAALETWTSHAARSAAADVCAQLAPAYRLPVIASRYRAMLQAVAEGACAA